MEKDFSQDKRSRSQTHNMRAQNQSAAAQLMRDRGKIKILWEKKVRDKVQSAESQTSIALLNSIDTFLDELVTALDQSTLESPQDLEKKGMSNSHGEQRAKFAGYYLPQLLKEFSILREVILEDLHNSDSLNYQVGLIINGAIDSAISLAATKFTAVQQTTIKAALEKAEVSNRDLEHFAAVAAHDLKSPLATISSYLDLLTEDASERLHEESIAYISVMQKASERMRNLVDRLLDYARLAKMDMRFHVVDLNDVMNSVLQNLHDTIQKTQAKITYQQMPTVTGDAQLLAQVFQNLIANSLKFHGGRIPTIQIDFKSERDSLLFSLKDNGIGFDPKDNEAIFALYKKLRGESEYQGAGIGLATCKKVVELHGGRIWANSQPGVGSTFYFTLPIPAATNTTTHH
ncbi:MAG: ATP-binding protein [Bdellovibrionaceae bacterium]|nr:ATP-binding protein [Pseudobdellovibrionaceae bacterium]